MLERRQGMVRLKAYRRWLVMLLATSACVVLVTNAVVGWRAATARGSVSVVGRGMAIDNTPTSGLLDESLSEHGDGWDGLSAVKWFLSTRYSGPSR